MVWSCLNIHNLDLTVRKLDSPWLQLHCHVRPKSQSSRLADTKRVNLAVVCQGQHISMSAGDIDNLETVKVCWLNENHLGFTILGLWFLNPEYLGVTFQAYFSLIGEHHHEVEPKAELRYVLPMLDDMNQNLLARVVVHRHLVGLMPIAEVPVCA